MRSYECMNVVNEGQEVLDYSQDRYENLYPYVESYVLSNNGTHEDACDIYHDAFVLLIEKYIVNDVVSSSDICIDALLVSISKKIWLQRLRKNKRYMPLTDENVYVVGDYTPGIVDEEQEIEMRMEIVTSSIAKLSHKDIRILLTSMNSSSSKEAAALLKKSEGYYRKLLHTVKKKLIDIVKRHPLYNEFFE